MPSLCDSDDRAEILARVNALEPDSARLWGTMTPDEMLCHVADQLRVALGDLPSRPRPSWLARRVIKPLVLYGIVKAPKGKVKTVSEMKTTRVTSFEADRATLRSLIDRLVATAESKSETAPHPVFGPMSPREWCRLSAEHLDHHLRQFGV